MQKAGSKPFILGCESNHGNPPPRVRRIRSRFIRCTVDARPFPQCTCCVESQGPVLTITGPCRFHGSVEGDGISKGLKSRRRGFEHATRPTAHYRIYIRPRSSHRLEDAAFSRVRGGFDSLTGYQRDR